MVSLAPRRRSGKGIIRSTRDEKVDLLAGCIYRPTCRRRPPEYARTASASAAPGVRHRQRVEGPRRRRTRIKHDIYLVARMPGVGTILRDRPLDKD